MAAIIFQTFWSFFLCRAQVWTNSRLLYCNNHPMWSFELQIKYMYVSILIQYEHEEKCMGFEIKKSSDLG